MKKLTFVTLLMAFLSVFTFGQTLEEHFKKVKVVKVDTKDVLKKVSERKDVKIGDFDLRLEPSDIRSANYRVEVSTSQGRVPGEMPVISTFKGTELSKTGSYVRLTINDTLEGYINKDGEMYFIESAKKYSKESAQDDFVIYTLKDKKKLPDFACGVDAELKKGLEMAQSSPSFSFLQPLSAMAANKLLEIATDADDKYLQDLDHFGAQQANAFILGLMNMVDGIYEDQLQTDIVVVYQHVWLDEPTFFDPNKDGDKYLEGFTNYWNTTVGFRVVDVPRDVALLFSGHGDLTVIRFGQRRGIGGLAYVGKTCGSLSYGIVSYNAPGEHILVAHELGHNLNAPHAETISGCADTIMDGTVAGRPFFCKESKATIDAFLGTEQASCVFNPLRVRQSFDRDNDEKADFAVYRPTPGAGTWIIQLISGGLVQSHQYGDAGDIPVAADYDGDGLTDLAIFRPTTGQWSLLRTSLSAGNFVVTFGQQNDIPVQGDYTGDGKADIAVFRPSDGGWYIYNVATQQFFASYQFGQQGDIPSQADYDGDGKFDMAVFRPLDGQTYIQRTRAGFTNVQFGAPGDKPVPADYDSDNKADVAMFRSGVWYILGSRVGNFSRSITNAGDIPIVGDYDGDEKADQCVYNTSNGTFTFLFSSNDQPGTVQLGMSGDIPIGFRNTQ